VGLYTAGGGLCTSGERLHTAWGGLCGAGAGLMAAAQGRLCSPGLGLHEVRLCGVGLHGIGLCASEVGLCWRLGGVS
jgi:hypothetical protein